MRVLVTDNADIQMQPIKGVEFVPFNESSPITGDDLRAGAVVCWGSPAALESFASMPNLKWVQSLSAGTDAFVAHGLPEGVILTSGRGLHDRTVSEHAVTLLLSLVRQMPLYFQDQQKHVWDNSRRGPRPMQLPDRVSSLIGAKVLIWGFGSIGQNLAKILTALGASVRGVAQKAGARAGYPVVDVSGIRSELPNTDVLVMILPSTAETKGALDSELLGLLPYRSIVCNVGRGATIHQGALIEALQDGTIAGAALDVFEEEPLPADSPLWDLPNCIITPHIAGFRADGGADLVRENLEALLDGRELTNVVDTGA